MKDYNSYRYTHEEIIPPILYLVFMQKSLKKNKAEKPAAINCILKITT